MIYLPPSNMIHRRKAENPSTREERDLTRGLYHIVLRIVQKLNSKLDEETSAAGYA
jgi:hypothetical protein